MALDAYLFYSHLDEAPHCEVRHEPSVPRSEMEAMNFAFVDKLLHGVGEDTIPIIGDTAVRLEGGQLVEVLSDVGAICDIHTILDPSAPHSETVDDYFITGASLI